MGFGPLLGPWLPAVHGAPAAPQAPAAASASPTRQQLSLQDAIRLGEQRLLSLQSAALTVQESQAALNLSQAAFLPRVDLVGLGTWARIGTNFGFITNVPTVGDLTLDLGANGSAVIQNTFGNLGVAVNYGLLDFRRGPLRDAARAGLRGSQALQAEEQRRSRLNVTTAYLNLQLADALVPVWQSALQFSTELLRDARAIRARGLAARIDTLQAEALVLSDRQGLAEARASQAIAASALARLLDFPRQQELAAGDPLVPGPRWPLPLGPSIDRALEQRPSLEALEQQRLARQAQVQLARASRLPSVGLLLGAGINGDVIIPEPDRFLPGRDPNPQVAFGAGIHFCIGAPLARLELQVALPLLFARLPRLALAGEPKYRNAYHFHGLERLDVTF